MDCHIDPDNPVTVGLLLMHRLVLLQSPVPQRCRKVSDEGTVLAVAE